MNKCMARSKDPFRFSGTHIYDRYIFSGAEDELKREGTSFLVEGEAMISTWEEDRKVAFSFLGGGSRGVEKNTAFARRLMIAAFGAAFLIGPMWLMMLRTDLETKLVSTTVFVAVFGLLMAYFIEEYKDVLSSTAAYAAVLVVFVGLSSPEGS